jgi:hypothetical protein
VLHVVPAPRPFVLAAAAGTNVRLNNCSEGIIRPLAAVDNVDAE